ncbi:MAG TPA: hypothetical protein VNK04_12625 [Gemmataceae bacterium]|nr:hypothetical protein [Gemmataceae bacterium]
MLREQLYDLLHRRPFQPFRVHLKDGRVFEIHYPEINLLGQSFIEIGIPEPDNPDPFAERTVFVLLSQIQQVEPLSGAASSTSP